jgi:hypothetical protein
MWTAASSPEARLHHKKGSPEAAFFISRRSWLASEEGLEPSATQAAPFAGKPAHASAFQNFNSTNCN